MFLLACPHVDCSLLLSLHLKQHARSLQAAAHTTPTPSIAPLSHCTPSIHSSSGPHAAGVRWPRAGPAHRILGPLRRTRGPGWRRGSRRSWAIQGGGPCGGAATTGGCADWDMLHAATACCQYMLPLLGWGKRSAAGAPVRWGGMCRAARPFCTLLWESAWWGGVLRDAR